MTLTSINLVLRFILEVCALTAFVCWGWAQGESLLAKLVLAALMPALFAGIWGIFAVPNDPSRSGAAPIPIAGTARLLLELGMFAIASLCMLSLQYGYLALAFDIAIVLHYITYYERILWLLRQ